MVTETRRSWYLCLQPKLVGPSAPRQRTLCSVKMLKPWPDLRSVATHAQFCSVKVLKPRPDLRSVVTQAISCDSLAGSFGRGAVDRRICFRAPCDWLSRKWASPALARSFSAGPLEQHHRTCPHAPHMTPRSDPPVTTLNHDSHTCPATSPLRCSWGNSKAPGFLASSHIAPVTRRSVRPSSALYNPAISLQANRHIKAKIRGHACRSPSFTATTTPAGWGYKAAKRYVSLGKATVPSPNPTSHLLPSPSWLTK